MSIFSENLTMAREKAHLTRKEMAKKLNISVTAYANYEYGEREPKFNTLIQIANILCVSTDDLLGFRLNKPDYVLSQLREAGFIIEPLNDGIYKITVPHQKGFLSDFDLHGSKDFTLIFDNELLVRFYNVAVKTSQEAQTDAFYRELKIVFKELYIEMKQDNNK